MSRSGTRESGDRGSEDELNATIEISDDEFNPMINLYPGAANTAATGSQEEDGIVLHPDEGDLAIDELDYEPAEKDRG